MTHALTLDTLSLFHTHTQRPHKMVVDLYTCAFCSFCVVSAVCLFFIPGAAQVEQFGAKVREANVVWTCVEDR